MEGMTAYCGCGPAAIAMAAGRALAVDSLMLSPMCVGSEDIIELLASRMAIMSSSCSSIVLYPQRVHARCPSISSGEALGMNPTFCLVKRNSRPILVVIRMVALTHLSTHMIDVPPSLLELAKSIGTPRVS